VLRLSPWNLISQMSLLAGHAMVAWLVIAIPAVVLMTFTLTVLLRRVRSLAASEAGD
jgi:hypothetical protein